MEGKEELVLEDMERRAGAPRHGDELLNTYLT